MEAKKGQLDGCLCGLSDQSRRIAIKPSIRLLTECLGMRSEIKGIEAPEQKALRPTG
jgi:hypothetical protein